MSISQFGLVKLLEKPLKLTIDCTCLVLETLSTLISAPARLKKILILELTQNTLALIEVSGSFLCWTIIFCQTSS